MAKLHDGTNRPTLGAADFSTFHARGMLALLATTAALALISANGCHIFLATRGQEISLLPSLAYGAAKWLWWGIVAFGLWWHAQKRPWILHFSKKMAFVQLSLGCVLSVLHLALLQLTLRIGLHWPVWRDAYSSIDYFALSNFGTDLIIYGFVFGISALLHMQAEKQQDALQKLELEKRLSQAQLHALQMQMEPHFLFNTLNAITSLVAQGRNPEAMKTLGHLNTILRTSLQRKAPAKVPFTEELQVIESYLAIQKARFAERLQVTIDVTPEALQGLVPSFLLQPIVENAIRHGIAPVEEGGLIETRVRRIGDKLWMQVRDNGCGVSTLSSKGHGIGMQNTRERLAFFYPDMHTFAAAPLAIGGYEVTIQIPYERTAS